jgi:hypothetical protein
VVSAPERAATNRAVGERVGTLIITRDDPAGGIDAQAIATLISDMLAG